MATKVEVAGLETPQPRAGGWRFSLGDLFRGMTVCALAVVAALQLGPLAAIRDVSLGVAIVLALEAWLSRSRWRWRWRAPALVAALGLVPTLLAAGAPFSDRTAICEECGMHRHIHETCGWTVIDEIQESECSRWAAPLVPAGHSHTWTVCSNHHRTHWFGMAPIGCGGPSAGAPLAWQLAQLEGQAAGERAYREYQDILTGKSTKPMAVHIREVHDALTAAVQSGKGP